VLAFLAEHSNSYRFYSVDVWIRSLPTFIIAVVTLVLLVVLAWRNGRTYCNTICPVGTILSFFARFSWLKIRFDEDKCKKCGKCSRNCKASCIDFKTMSVDYSRCVVCGDCLEQCKFDSLHYAGPGAGNSRKTRSSSSSSDSRNTSDSVDEGRRSFLVGAALATTAAALAQEKKKVDGGLAVIEDKLEPVRHTPITPPGSLSASNMQKRCTGCQLCVSECPNDVLRPSTDLMKLMQPMMSYERGYCRPECHRCSEVCPAGAIQPITLADKSSTQIGHAVWVKKNCIPVTDGVECGNCERHCPVGAIEMVMLDENDEESVMIPSVNEARCIGCGACENLCPARPFAAIYVEGHEVHKTV
jgi:ferredoxin